MSRGIRPTTQLPEYRAMLTATVLLCAAAAMWNIFPAFAGWIPLTVLAAAVGGWVIRREWRIARRWAAIAAAPLVVHRVTGGAR